MGGIVDAIFGGGPDAPQPDPAIGQAAAANAEVGKEALQLGREQWAWNQAKVEEVWPQTKKVIEQQIAIGDENQRRSAQEWDAYQRLYLPAEERYVKQTLEWDSPARRTEREQMAVADVNKGYDTARGTMERGLTRAGVRPGGAGYTQAAGDLARAQAADTAGAINTSRRQVEAEGMAGLERLTNIGRGRPSTSFAADQTALSAGNSGIANQNQTTAASNAGMSSAQGWYNTGLAGYRGQGNILGNQYNAQLRGYEADQKASGGLWSGLGQLAGSYFAGGFGKKDGGMVNGYANGGLVRRANRRLMKMGYASGGMIDGPGTETSDSVPAIIDGQRPAALSTGEAVLNAEAVKLVGEEFVHNINQAGLERRGKREPQVIDGMARRVA